MATIGDVQIKLGVDLEWSTPPKYNAPGPSFTAAYLAKLFGFPTLPPVRLEHDWHAQWVTDPSGVVVEAQIPHFSPTLEHAKVLEPNTPTVEPGSRGWVHRNGVWQPEPKVYTIVSSPFSPSLGEWGLGSSPFAWKAWQAQVAKMTFHFPQWSDAAVNPSPVIGALESIVPGIRGAVVRCPACVDVGEPPPEPSPLTTIVVHLNDHHKWTREAVADWLDTLDDIDLTVQRKEVA